MAAHATYLASTAWKPLFGGPFCAFLKYQTPRRKINLGCEWQALQIRVFQVQCVHVVLATSFVPPKELKRLVFNFLLSRNRHFRHNYDGMRMKYLPGSSVVYDADFHDYSQFANCNTVAVAMPARLYPSNWNMTQMQLSISSTLGSPR